MSQKRYIPLIGQFPEGPQEPSLIKHSPSKESSRNVEITQQQVSIVAAFFLIVSFFIFLFGYFWGQKQNNVGEISQMTVPIFADTLFAVDVSKEKLNQESNLMEQKETVTKQADQSSEGKPLDESTTDQYTVLNKANVLDEKKQDVAANYKELGKFLNQQDALSFIGTVKKDKNVKLVLRKSKTAQGKEFIWYQVITELNHDIQTDTVKDSIVEKQSNDEERHMQ